MTNQKTDTNKEYVLGYICEVDQDDDLTGRFLLIRKDRTSEGLEWQKGKLNGVGGKVLPDEHPLESMIRECKEETGLDIQNWWNVGRMIGTGWKVSIYCTTHHNLEEAKSSSEGPLVIADDQTIRRDMMVPNVPMHLIASLDYIETTGEYTFTQHYA